MKFIPQILLVGIVLILSSCSKKSLMNYYYPINEQVRIFKYDVNEANETEYWKVSADKHNHTLLTESFGTDFKLYNVFKEVVSDEKSKLIKYADFENGVELPSVIERDFVFSKDEKSSYSYRVKYRNSYGQLIFEKNRIFDSFGKIIVKDKKYDVAVFNDEYFFSYVGKNDKYHFTQTTYYAKDIGMIKYIRQLPNGFVKILELEKVLTEKEFEALK